ncbi:hypothetical protein [Candidatus Poriferisodalis sp.]|uniref:hypothetical protein n=1 Tax=Candidatus Poriferisodalis sp. TaxID=3101277 RepID=UPI003B0159AB
MTVPRRDSGLRAEISELVGMLRSYIVQEAVGPLRGLGRYVLFGLTGAIGVSLGVVLGALGVVRVLQAETDLFNANWSFVPHVAGAVFLLMAIALLVRAIRPKHTDAAAPEPAALRPDENAAGDGDG